MGGLCAARAVMALVMVGMAGLLPTVVAELHGERLYGAAFSGMGLAMVWSIVLAGHFAATREPGRLVAASLAMVALGTAVVAASPTMATVLAGRVVQGLGLGLLTVVVWAGVGAGVPPDRRARAGRALSAAWAAAALVGPVGAGALSDAVSWRAAFALVVPVSIGTAVFSVPAMRRLSGRLHGAGKLPFREATWLGSGLAAVVVGLGQPRPTVTVAALLGAGSALAAWALGRVLPAGTLRLRRGAPATVAAAFLAGFAMFGTQAFVPLALRDVHGASATVIGLAVATSPLTWVLGSALHMRLAARWRPAKMLRLGAGTLAGAVGAMQLALVRDVPLAVPIGVWALAGFGMGVTYNTTTVAGFAASDGRTLAPIAAALQLADAVAITVGAALSGAVVSWGAAFGVGTAGSLRAAWALAAVVAGSAAALAGRLPVEEPSPA